jgi:hypothetical protein
MTAYKTLGDLCHMRFDLKWNNEQEKLAELDKKIRDQLDTLGYYA